MPLTADQKWHASWIIGAFWTLVVAALIAWATMDMITCFIILGLGWAIVVLPLWFLTPARLYLVKKAAISLVVTLCALFAWRWVYVYDRPILNLEMRQVVVKSGTGSSLVLDTEALLENVGRQSGNAEKWDFQLIIDGSKTEGKQLFGQTSPSEAATEPDLSAQDFPPGKPVRGWLYFDFPTVSHEYAQSNFTCGSPALDRISVRLTVWDSRYQRERSDSKHLNELGKGACLVPTPPAPAKAPASKPVTLRHETPGLRADVAASKEQRCETGSLCNQDSQVNAPQTINNLAPIDRHLTQDQITAIGDVLRALPQGVQIQVYTPQASEAYTFGKEIADLARKENKAEDLIEVLEPLPKGTYVLIKSKDDISYASALQLANIMNAHGIPVTSFEAHDYIKAGTIRVIS